MKIVLLSEWKQPLSSNLEQKIMHMIGVDAPVLGYIPSQTDPEGTYFKPMKQLLDRAGFSDYVYCDIDKAFEKTVLGNLGNCDAIFLSGGNTFHFLARLKERNLLSWLRNYVENGGVLIGVSAGAMVLTDNIQVAEYVDAKYLSSSPLDSSQYVGAGLGGFHFYPHWREDPSQLAAVSALKEKDDRPIFACQDGGGIVMDEGRREYFGHVIEF